MPIELEKLTTEQLISLRAKWQSALSTYYRFKSRPLWQENRREDVLRLLGMIDEELETREAKQNG